MQRTTSVYQIPQITDQIIANIQFNEENNTLLCQFFNNVFKSDADTFGQYGFFNEINFNFYCSGNIVLVILSLKIILLFSATIT